MSHRTDIREGVKAQLTGRTPAGATVLTSRSKPVSPADFPALLVYLGEAKRGRAEHDGSLFQRNIMLVIEGALVATDEAIETAAEDFAEAIEQAIEHDRTIGGLVIETRWQSTDIDIVVGSAQPIAAVRVEYDIEVYTNEYVPAGLGYTDPTPPPAEVLVGPTPTSAEYAHILGAPDPIIDRDQFVVAPDENTDSLPSYGGEYQP